MSFSPFRSPKTSSLTFQNYFYQIKPHLSSRPSTPPPFSKTFTHKNCFQSQRDHSFHLMSKTPSTKNFSLIPQRKVELTPNSSPNSNLINIYQMNLLTTSATNDEGSIDLVEYETQKSSKTQRKLSGRELSFIRLEQKNLNDYLRHLEAKIKKIQEEEKNIKKKIEITENIEKKICQKRNDIEKHMQNLKNKKWENENKKIEIRQKNLLEKKLHQQNLQKTKENILKNKQSNASKLKENKENLMQNANFSKRMELSEKLIKVNTVKNMEKKIKQQRSFNLLSKEGQIKDSLYEQIENEKKNLIELQNMVRDLEQKEEISKERLEQTKELHLKKYSNFQKLFEQNKGILNYFPEKKGYTNCSTATFENKNSINSEIVTFDDEYEDLKQGVVVKTSVISLETNNNKFY